MIEATADQCIFAMIDAFPGTPASPVDREIQLETAHPIEEKLYVAE